MKSNTLKENMKSNTSEENLKSDTSEENLKSNTLEENMKSDTLEGNTENSLDNISILIKEFNQLNISHKDFNPIFFFYHIEKCGGTSLRIILLNYFKNFIHNSLIYFSDNYNNINLLSDDHYIELYKIYGDNILDNKKFILCHSNLDVEKYYFNNLFSFTVVRNPIDRIISHYYHFDYSNYKVKLHELPNDILKRYIIGNGNLMVHRMSNGICLQENYYTDNKLIIDAYMIALNNIKKISYIMILENFNEDIVELNNKLNKYFNVEYKFNIQYENINKNKKIYEEDINAINQYLIYLKDVDLYNYIKLYRKI